MGADYGKCGVRADSAVKKEMDRIRGRSRPETNTEERAGEGGWGGGLGGRRRFFMGAEGEAQTDQRRDHTAKRREYEQRQRQGQNRFKVSEGVSWKGAGREIGKERER